MRVAVLLLVLAVAAAVALSYWRPTPVPARDPADVARIAALEAANRDLRRSMDTLTASAARDTTTARAAEGRARAAAAGSEPWRRMADSLAGAARTSADSATLWHAAYEARTQERDSLALAYQLERDSVARHDADAARKLFAVRDSAAVMQAHYEEIDARNTREIARLTAAGRCRIIGPVPCPTRPVSALIGLGVGLLVH